MWFVAASVVLLAPVPGEVLRSYAVRVPFAPGQHRGVDLAGAPGDPVRAPCTGRIVFAGRTPQGAAISIRCGDRRVTVLPATATTRGAVARGETIGQVTDGEHPGLHLSVRHNGHYEEPDLATARAPTTAPSPPPLARPPSSPAAVRPAPPLATEVPARPEMSRLIGLAGVALAAAATLAAPLTRRKRRAEARALSRQPA